MDGGGGGGQQASCLVAKQAVEFPQVLASINENHFGASLHELDSWTCSLSLF